MLYSNPAKILKLVLVAATCVSTGALLERAACNRDNCFRAVAASAAKPGPEIASRDCSSFQAAHPSTTRVYMITSTRTVTKTVTDTTIIATTSPNTPPTAPAAITQTPATATTITSNTNQAAATVPDPSAALIPTYASSACPVPSRYASACSCPGITAPVTTSASITQLTTTTMTVHATATATKQCPGSSFALEITPNNSDSTSDGFTSSSSSSEGTVYDTARLVLDETNLRISPGDGTYSCFTLTEGGLVMSNGSSEGSRWNYVSFEDVDFVRDDELWGDRYQDGAALVCGIEGSQHEQQQQQQGGNEGDEGVERAVYGGKFTCERDSEGRSLAGGRSRRRMFGSCLGDGQYLSTFVVPNEGCEELELVAVP